MTKEYYASIDRSWMQTLVIVQPFVAPLHDILMETKGPFSYYMVYVITGTYIDVYRPIEMPFLLQNFYSI